MIWLPDELLLKIFTYLRLRDLLIIRDVSQRWNQVVKDKSLYKKYVNKRNREGKTPLMEVITNSVYHYSREKNIKRKYGVSKILIEMGSDVNIQDREGETALMYAVRNTHVTKELVELLITAGSNLNLRDIHGNTALKYALSDYSRNKYTMQIIKLLLLYGADPNITYKYGRTLIFTLVKKRQTNYIKLFIKYGAKVDPELFFNSINSDPTIADTLLPGMDPNAKYNKGKTLLMYLVKKNNQSLAKKLIELGADLDIQDSRGDTALNYAIYDLNREMVELLLSAGANPDIYNDNGNTSLHCAIRKRRKDINIIRLLIEYVVDIDTQTIYEGETALMMAVYREEGRICRLLIDNGADLDTSNHLGRTVREIAEDKNFDLFKLGY